MIQLRLVKETMVIPLEFAYRYKNVSSRIEIFKDCQIYYLSFFGFGNFALWKHHVNYQTPVPNCSSEYYSVMKEVFELVEVARYQLNKCEGERPKGDSLQRINEFWEKIQENKDALQCLVRISREMNPKIPLKLKNQ